jgi:hypothetical protein
MGNAQGNKLGELTMDEIEKLASMPMTEDPMKLVLREYTDSSQFEWLNWKSASPARGNKLVSLRYPSTWPLDDVSESKASSGPFKGARILSVKFGDLVNVELTVKQFAGAMNLKRYSAMSLDEVQVMIEHMQGKFKLNECAQWLDGNARRILVFVRMDDDGVTLDSATAQIWAVRDNCVYQLVFSYPQAVHDELKPIVQRIIDSLRIADDDDDDDDDDESEAPASSASDSSSVGSSGGSR